MFIKFVLTFQLVKIFQILSTLPKFFFCVTSWNSLNFSHSHSMNFFTLLISAVPHAMLMRFSDNFDGKRKSENGFSLQRVGVGKLLKAVNSRRWRKWKKNTENSIVIHHHHFLVGSIPFVSSFSRNLRQPKGLKSEITEFTPSI